MPSTRPWTRRIRQTQPKGLAPWSAAAHCLLCESAKGWLPLTNGIIGEGRALFRAVVDADLEGIVAKRLADAYHPKLLRWHKVLNRGYSQRRGRAEWFRDRRGRSM
jgi:hypothetical protein